MKQITGRYKIVLTLLILYVVLMAVLFGPSLFVSHEEMYLLIGNTAKWKYDGEKWSDIEEDEKNLYSWENYDVYIDQEKLGNIRLSIVKINGICLMMIKNQRIIMVPF